MSAPSIAAVLLVPSALATALSAQEPLEDATVWLPPTAVVVVHGAGSSAVAQSLVDLAHALGDVPRDLPAPAQTLVGAGSLMLRTFLQAPPGESGFAATIAGFATRMAGGGFAFGLVPGPAAGSSWQLVAALRPGDLAAAQRWLAQHGSALALRVERDYLLLASSESLLATMGPAPAAGGADPAATPRWWQAAAAASAPVTVCGAVDLAALRRLGKMPPAAHGLDAPGAFLFGPVASAIERATGLHFAVRAVAPASGQRQAAVRVTLQLDGSAVDDVWAPLLATGAAGRSVLKPPADLVLSWNPDRSLARWLATPSQWLPEAAATRIDGFLSIANSFCGPGSTFVDFLEGLAEPLSLWVMVPHVPDPEACPPLLLPDMALFAPMRDERAGKVARNMLNVLAVVANAERMQQRQAPVVVRNWYGAAGTGLLVEMPEWAGPDAPPIETALSPVLATGSGHLVLASTQRAAERVLRALEDGNQEHVVGDVLRLDGRRLAAALRPSHKALALARMLDEGEDQAAAQQFFAVFDAIANSIGPLQLAVRSLPGRTELEFSLERAR